MTATGLKHTLIVSAIAIVSMVVAWYVFKIVFHVVAALLTGIIVLGLALYVYFKFFRKPGHSDATAETK